MKRLLVMCLCAAFAVSTANAEEYKYGPFNNYEGYEERSAGVVIPMTGEFGFHDPFSDEDYMIDSKGGGTYWIKYAVPVFSATYYGFETEEGAAFDPDTDYVTLTDIVAKNIEPDHDPCEIPELTGFDPGDPDIVLLSGGAQTGGWYEGTSGTMYHADVCAVTLADLGTVMDGYDVSKFTGSSSSIVYVQQAVVPANDIMPMVFTYDYKGYVEEGDAEWVGSYDANFPYQHSWDVNIIQMNPQVSVCNDVDVDAPTVIPGYIQVVPPENWGMEAIEIGRYGYKANSSIYGMQNAGVYTDFKVNAYYPEVEQGLVTLTYENVVVSGYVSAKVPKAKPQCGDWGYSSGDLDKDCDVDLSDFALYAQKWLGCTNPDGAGCEPEGIIGAGFAFDGGDTDGPARILYLYDDLNADILEANDIIVEYRGTEVSDGNELLTAICAMDDVEAGETISMTIDRDDIVLAVEPQMVLQWVGYITNGPIIPNARCTYLWSFSQEVIVAGHMCRCVADPDVEWCSQQFYLTPYGDCGKVANIGGQCTDSTGNRSSEPQIWRGQVGPLAK